MPKHKRIRRHNRTLRADAHRVAVHEGIPQIDGASKVKQLRRAEKDTRKEINGLKHEADSLEEQVRETAAKIGATGNVIAKATGETVLRLYCYAPLEGARHSIEQGWLPID